MENPVVRVAVVPGDGIGPEVCASAVEILQQAAHSINFKFNYFDGGAKTFLEQGTALPEETLKGCREADAILHGAVGLPEVVYPDGTEAGQDFSMMMRAELDLFANIRPVRSFAIGATASDKPAIDYVIVRENTEGLYAARAGGNILQDRLATDTMVITREGVERVVHEAARVAMRRSGAPADGKRRITVVDKANVLRSFAFFRKVALQVLENYPDIEVDCMLVDAMTARMLQRPEYLDVVVTENMFGDILSDLGAATVGGMGMAPSAEISRSRGYFQSVHGSAPDIVGTSKANPIASILSAGMLLEWLGDKKGDDAMTNAGLRIHAAVAACLSEGQSLTPDLGGTATTQECTAAVKRHLADIGS